MKKLKLNLEQFSNVQVLTRNQLKNVLGGGGTETTMPGGGGRTPCTSDADCPERLITDTCGEDHTIKGHCNLSSTSGANYHYCSWTAISTC